MVYIMLYEMNVFVMCNALWMLLYLLSLMYVVVNVVIYLSLMYVIINVVIYPISLMYITKLE